MQQERSRILKMLADGQIAIDECEELLRSLGERKARRAELEMKKASQGKRPAWPLVLLGLLVIWMVLSSTVAPRLSRGGYVFQWSGLLGIGSNLPGVLLLGLAAFWIWMIIDCLTRHPSDFRLLFTREFRYEKWIWLAVVILGQGVGAIVYFVAVRAPARSLVASQPTEAAPETPQVFVPRPRARGLLPWVLLLVVVSALAWLSIHGLTGRSFARVGPSLTRVGWHTSFWGLSWVPLAGFPLVVLGAVTFLFWIWMFVDCLSRDYREFGTLITSDKSADKLVWLLLIILLPAIGAIAYHVGVRRRTAEARSGA